MARRQYFVHYFSKLICLIAVLLLVKQVYVAYRDAPRDLRLILLLIAELYTAIPILLALYSERVDRSFPMVLITIACSCYFLCLDLQDNGIVIVPYPFAKYIQIAGISLMLSAKIFIGRSFGLLPANRGIVQSGPYRWVRHPMYLGYFLNHLGFLLCTFTLYNLALYSALYTMIAYRLFKEEELLRADPQYVAYSEKVRYRLIPGLF